MKLSCVCIDSGEDTEPIKYINSAKPGSIARVFAIKGSNDSAAAYIQKPSKSNREGAYLFTLGVDTGKSLLMDRLKLEEEGPGFCHFPKEEGKGYDEKYFKGLTSEKKGNALQDGQTIFCMGTERQRRTQTK